MEIPEFCILFSKEGDFDVEVNTSISPRKMNADEIIKLIDPYTGVFYTKMTFDDYPREVSKYQIDPVKRKIKITVKSPNQTTISQSQLNWQCRRGTQELDRLLLNYLNTEYENAGKNEQQLFKQLLKREDSDLLRFLLDNQLPEEPQLAEFIQKIRNTPIIHP